MKKNLIKLGLPMLLLGAILFSASCQKNDPVADKDKDEEQVEIITPEPDDVIEEVVIGSNDNKSGGIYKATLVGSTGSVKLVLQGEMKSAYITFDNTTMVLPTTDLENWTSGQPISNATFGNGDWKIVFSVNGDGTNPRMDVTIPNHNVLVIVFKETTQNSVTTYEGQYQAGQGNVSVEGTLNFVITNDTTIKAALKTTDNEIVVLNGTLKNRNIVMKGSSALGNITAEGIMDDNGLAFGTFSDIAKDSTYAVTGNWTSRRTL
ncbi:MAG: hypothetical protein EOP46_13460, partial [Sphingobacteriaceae bacterium]